MHPTKSPLNQGIRWPYPNRPYPALKSVGRLLTNQLTSFTGEASTVHVRGSYHRERSHCSYPCFTLRPGASRLSISPRGPLFMPSSTFGVVYSNNPRRHKHEVNPHFLVPWTSTLLMTWRIFVVTWTLSPEASCLR